jgi:hypothetical protein
MSIEYILGRAEAKLVAPYKGQDMFYAGQRLNDIPIKEITNADYSHCTFANMSFLSVKIQDSTFLNCVFISCYFRKSQWVYVDFTACKFINCNFDGLDPMTACDFMHSRFDGCILPSRESLKNFPGEPNLQRELARNLAMQAEKIGDWKEALIYRLKAISADEEHCWQGFIGATEWYKKKYDLPDRLKLFYAFIFSKFNKMLWGYGESLTVLIRNLGVFILLYPLVLYFYRDGFIHAGITSIKNKNIQRACKIFCVNDFL